jgi:dCTP deaminase
MMALLVDRQIRELCAKRPDIIYPEGWRPMIEPFSENVSEGVISYGLDHAGYCLRLAEPTEDNPILIFHGAHGKNIDPKKFKDPDYIRGMFYRITYAEKPVTIPGNGYALVCSHETIRIPRHLKGRCVGKSTYARAGIIVNTTPLEPEWEGVLTVEISNSAPSPGVLHVMEGICQLEFEQLAGLPEVSYRDKKGVYQGQTGTTTARVK